MQLVKLCGFQRKQALSCKTGDKRGQFNQRLTSEKQNPQLFDLVIQRDDGRYQLGLAGEVAGFETRSFAASIAAHETNRIKRTRHQELWVSQ